ncbi:putative DnaJ domain, Chaperone J-domain superfamily [Arabidopsis thaliana]
MDSFVSVENKPLPTDMEFTMEEATKIVERKLSEKDYVGAKNLIVKKHYKQLALLLHPDKNKCYGAEGAFKLVSEAWCLLSDKVQRSSYDQRRKNSKQGKSSKPKAADSSKQRKSRTFWTMCRSCKTKGEFLRHWNLNKAILCPNCRQIFIATEITTKEPNKSTKKASHQQQQWSIQDKVPIKSTKNASSSPSVTLLGIVHQQRLGLIVEVQQIKVPKEGLTHKKRLLLQRRFSRGRGQL